LTGIGHPSPVVRLAMSESPRDAARTGLKWPWRLV